mgnify:CR=1 FL=1
MLVYINIIMKMPNLSYSTIGFCDCFRYWNIIRLKMRMNNIWRNGSNDFSKVFATFKINALSFSATNNFNTTFLKFF